MKNPKTGKLEERRLKNPPRTAGNTALSALYKLVVEPDNSFSISVNDHIVREGNLITDFDSPNPKMISDPESTKPASWDDRELYSAY